MRWLAEHTTPHCPSPNERPDPPPSARLGHPDPAVARLRDRRRRRCCGPRPGEPQRDWLADAWPGARGAARQPGRRRSRPPLLPRPKGLPGGWPAVVYPSLTPTGEITYLQARYLDPPANRSKYDNPSARLAANPRLAWTRPVGPPRDGVLVVCEGTADALIAAQAGIAVGRRARRRLPRPSRRRRDRRRLCANTPSLRGAEVVICFDSDSAGAAGSARLVELLAERDVAAQRVPAAGRPRPDHVGGGRASLDGRTAHPTRHRGGPDDRASPRRAAASPVAERSISIGGIG